MVENFSEMLAVGGKSNSLGKVNEIIEIVLRDKSRLDELYACLFDENAWVRMRGADALEKICRVRSDWLQPYVNKLNQEVAPSKQPSIQWHLAQIYGEIELTDRQQHFAINWLKQLLSSPDIDWIVAANAMDALMQFAQAGSVPKSETISLLKIQQKHQSKAVVKRADKLLEKFSR